MSDRPLRIGIVGAGWGVHAHLPAWRSLDDVEVVAICTSRPDTAAAAAAAHRIPRAYHDLADMIADPAIDVIDCGSRPPLRVTTVFAALRAGKHVYNGVPFSVTHEQAVAIERARHAARVVGAVDAYLPAVPQLRHMKHLIDAGQIGDPWGMRATIDLPLFLPGITNVPDYAWFGDPGNGTSAFRNLGSHLLHLLVAMVGPVAAIAAQQSVDLAEWSAEPAPVRPAVCDHASALLRFASGVRGTIAACWSMAGGAGFRCEAWGSAGRLVATAPGLPQAYDTQLIFHGPGRLGEDTSASVPVPAHLQRVASCSLMWEDPAPALFPIAAVMADMRDAIARRDRAHGFARAVHVQAVVDAAERAAATGCWIDLPASDL